MAEAAQVPAKEHYRPATAPERQCSTCRAYAAGVCTMFPGDPPVSPSYVCDGWEAPEPAHPPAQVGADHHNAVLEAARARVDELEPKLVAVLTPMLRRVGEEAARNFLRFATNHLTAAGPLTGVKPTSTMICLRPRQSEAEAIADPDGSAPSDLHVTLAYLGEIDGDLKPLLDVLAPVAGSHGPLAGVVGGYGEFQPPGCGILLPDVPGLVELRVAVTEALTQAGIDYGRDHGFTPHITVDGDPEDGEIDEMLERAAGNPLHFDSLLIVRGDAEMHELPLVGPRPLTASAAPRAVLTDDLILYHITVPDNVAKILKEGLLPQSQTGGPALPTGQLLSALDDGTFLATAEQALVLVEQIKELTGEEPAIFEVTLPKGTEVVKDALMPEGSLVKPGGIPPSEVHQVSLSRVEDRARAPENSPDLSAMFDRAAPRAAEAATEGDVATWTAPAADELIDADALVAQFRGKTDPIRLALIREVLGAAFGAPGVTAEEAIAYYHSPSAFELNDALRTGKLLTVEQQSIVNALDAAMEPSPRAMTLYRGLPNGAGIDLGKTPGYLSTSEDLATAEQFAGGIAGPGDQPVVMEIKVPKGTPMLHIPAGDYGDQQEWLLPREIALDIKGASPWKILTGGEETAAELEDEILDWPGEASDVAGAALADVQSGKGELWYLRDAAGKLGAVANVEYGKDSIIVHNIASGGGRGAGTELIGEIAKAAQEYSSDFGIRLLATPDSAPFYEKLGFERQAAQGAEIPFYLEPGKTADLARAARGGGTYYTDGFGSDTEKIQATVTDKGVISASREGVAEGAGLAFDVSNPLIDGLIAQTGQHITSIVDTTRANVMRVIGSSYEAGLSIPDTAKAIRAVMTDAAPKRAIMIARTEMTSAVNGASLASANLIGKTLGTSMKKTWLTAPGAQYPRHEDYEGLDGQTVLATGKFQVGEDELQYPGDPDGSPEEVINCRCAMTYSDGTEVDAE